ncbi:uncharacterized protein LOC116417823 [Nasonia vitripennis]|uniref:Uncharacterized protein n=1 Tax=Nasonia vitripennis TaxID=7425 RepID=A0A7M7QPC1_NASVI|nr:uncharacterized protein LOC116417823 [Nasonia vitripennis]
MEQHIDLIEELQKEVLQEEISYPDLKTLNKNLYKNDSYILHLNIRSLNANFNKLEIFIKSLKIKPSIIVCTETWKMFNCQIFTLKGYKLYYNNGKINQNDGVVVYIQDGISETTEVIEIDAMISLL